MWVYVYKQTFMSDVINRFDSTNFDFDLFKIIHGLYRSQSLGYLFEMVFLFMFLELKVSVY